jgi:hypothetical protein
MSRIRSIHPGLWTDVEFVAMSPFARLLFIGIWNECDDKGIFLWSPLQLKMRVLPADNIDASALLAEIEAAGSVRRYEIDGKAYGVVKNFAKFQRPKKPNDLYPAPFEALAFAGHSSEPLPDQENKVRKQFPTDGEKSSQMEDGGGNTEPNGSGVPPTAIDVQKAIFDTGVTILKAAGRNDREARSILGRWRKQFSDSEVLTALSRCQVERPSEPVEWVTKALQAERNRQHGQPVNRYAPASTVDAVQRAFELTGDAPHGSAAGPPAGDHRIGQMPDPVRPIGYVER